VKEGHACCWLPDLVDCHRGSFHVVGPAKVKAQWPHVFSWSCGMTREWRLAVTDDISFCCYDIFSYNCYHKQKKVKTSETRNVQAELLTRKLLDHDLGIFVWHSVGKFPLFGIYSKTAYTKTVITICTKSSVQGRYISPLCHNMWENSTVQQKKRHRWKRYALVVVRLMSRHNATINVSQLYLKLIQFIPDSLILQLQAHHLSILVVVVLQVYTQYHSINAYNSPEGNYI